MPTPPADDSDPRVDRLTVPSEDGGVLSAPPLRDAVRAAIRTQQRLDSSQLDLQGRTLQQLRDWSRSECFKAAAQFTSSIVNDEVAAPPATGPLIIAGHQPTLFHPGVWIKNFAIAGLAETTQGVALNLIVDDDILNQTGVRVPAGKPDAPHYETVLFDEPREPQPWEDVDCRDRAMFASFADRIVAHMKRWDVDPIVADVWPDAVRSLDRSSRLVDALTAARHNQEVRWGTANLELPVSDMCQTEPFLWFASHVLAQLPRFHEIHNRVLADYRAAHHIRSRSHPVPALADADGWLEAPFWLWRPGEHHRHPVLARQVGRELQLSDSREVVARLKLALDMEACCAVEELRRLSADGLRFRTRALTTTMFSRVALGDLFVHGIGGAKYDELTDRIIAEFFGIAPPQFLTLSATLHLPFSFAQSLPPSRTAAIRREMRDLRYNAERHAPASDISQLVERKQELIAAQHAAHTSGLSRSARRARREDNRHRYLQLKEITALLSAAAGPRQRELEAELEQSERDDATRRLLFDRDYAWCLHPAERLRNLMASLDFASAAPESNP